MAKKVSNFTDLVQRVTASCLLHPLGSSRFDQVQMTPDRFTYPTISEELLKSADSKEEDDKYSSTNSSCSEDEDDDDDGVVERSGEIYADARAMAEYKRMNLGSRNGNGNGNGNGNAGGDSDLWGLMSQVFDSVSAMKRAYGRLQEAHSPWDPEKMAAADAAVVAELRRLAVLRERFRRGAGRRRVATPTKAVETVREVVAPYEAAVEEMKREVREKEVEVEELKEKVKCLSVVAENGGKKNGRSLSRKKGSSSLVCSPVPSSPTPDMFESTMAKVRETSKSFTQHLLSLMRAARWDLASAVRSIETAITSGGAAITAAVPHHKRQAKYALESYVLRKVFQGFDHETFYMDGTLTSLLNPSQFRHGCFSKFKDMKSMDPSELLGILPSSPFGNFCSKKYQEIVHPKMEESLFGNLEQRNSLLNGSHPRTRFYMDFLGLAKAVWSLHLLAFSLDPPPAHFEAGRGAEYHPGYMESVVRYPGGKVPSGQVVGFPVSPGFKLGNGSVVRARVYLVPRG